MLDVIEVLVKEGDTINKDASLITLEGDKATWKFLLQSVGTD